MTVGKAVNIAIQLFKSGKGAAEVLAALMEQDDIKDPRVIVAAAMDKIGYLEELENDTNRNEQRNLS